MKYTKEQRLNIGKRIYDGELSRYEVLCGKLSAAAEIRLSAA